MDGSGNELVCCSACRCQVHQHCYGEELRQGKPQGEWTCVACRVWTAESDSKANGHAFATDSAAGGAGGRGAAPMQIDSHSSSAAAASDMPPLERVDDPPTPTSLQRAAAPATGNGSDIAPMALSQTNPTASATPAAAPSSAATAAPAAAATAGSAPCAAPSLPLPFAPNQFACALCPVTGGVLKPTVDHQWVHLSCALRFPQLLFVPDGLERQRVDGLSQVRCAVRRCSAVLLAHSVSGGNGL
jgi:hypothetical protein